MESAVGVVVSLANINASTDDDTDSAGSPVSAASAASAAGIKLEGLCTHMCDAASGSSR